MLRLILPWVVLTALVFGVRYFVDQFQRKEAGRWGMRIIWSAGISAACLIGVIFLERM